MPEGITFGSRVEGIGYTGRRAAYAVVVGEHGTVAAVGGKPGLFWLPGGDSLPDEAPEDTLAREVREELDRSVRLGRHIGEATQYFYASADDRHYEMRAGFFLAELTDEPSGQGDHELHWLPIGEAEGAFFHECLAWAVRQV